MRLFLIFLLLGWCRVVSAQNEANIWYFGQLAGVDFNGGTPVALTNGQLNTFEGCATICDASGSLLFYTDGISVWNANHVQMPNGFGLLGDPSSAQSGIIIPKPGNSSRYYIFTVAAQGNPGGFCYSEVDMTLNGGLGDVIAATKNTQLFTPSVEKCAAVKHANGLYVWVLAHGYNNNRYYAYLVDCNGVNAPVITDVGSVEGFPGWGCLTVSPNGQQLATAMRSVGFEILDFDDATGIVSNPLLLYATTECYGVSFSPDNNVLYGLRITGGEISQWDLQAGSPAAIIASRYVVGTAAGNASPYRGGTLQIGPDGRIYYPQHGQPFLATINNPNVTGAGCNHQTNSVDLLGRNALLGLPPFIQSFFDTTTAIVTSAVACTNQPQSFSVGGNTSYLDSVSWNFGDPASGGQNTSTAYNPSHTYANGGSYSVRLIRYLGCIADTTLINLTVFAPVTGTQNIMICPGSSFTLPGGGTATGVGSYTDTIAASNGCDSIVTTVISFPVMNVDAGNNASICAGSSTNLQASGGLVYSWSPSGTLSNANIANPVATPLTTTTYTVSSQVPVGNAIVNGDFSSGNTGFNSGYTFTSNLLPEGTYFVGPNPQAGNGGFAPCPDHTSGSGNMMIVNGSGTPNQNVWCQTVAVVPGTSYAFSCWVQNVVVSSPAILQFSINGSLIGPVFSAPAVNCAWTQFYAIWNSGANTTANICIVNQNNTLSGNDFALDDISFAQLCTATDSVVVTVNPLYSDSVYPVICQGNTYVFPDGSSSSTTSNNVTTLTSSAGCDSTITTFLTVNPAYTTNINDSICNGQSYVRPTGIVVTAAGVYHDTLTTTQSCDSIIITTLTVLPAPVTTVSVSICTGGSYMLPGGSVASAAGFYYDTLYTVLSCDSVVVTNLSLLPVPAGVVDTFVCPGTSYIRPSGVAVSTPGTYYDTISTPLGCDSAVVTNLWHYPVYNDTVFAGFCNGNSYTLPDGSSTSAAGMYVHSLLTQYGCDSIIVTDLTEVFPSVSATITDALCAGDSSGSFTAVATGVSPFTFSFSQGGIPLASSPSGELQNLPAGSYEVLVTDLIGCTATTTVTIYEPLPVLAGATADSASCYSHSDGSVTITASGGTPPYNYTLLDVNGTDITSTIHNLAAGAYLYVATDVNGCADTGTIQVFEPAPITVQINPDTVMLQLGESMQLQATSNFDPNVVYQWSPSLGLSCGNCPNPVVETYFNMTYSVTAQLVTDGAPCEATASLPVAVIPDYQVFIPNVFSPNGDGINDYFQLYGNIAGIKQLSVQIFNRFGEKIYESRDINFQWNGMYKGEYLNPCVLVYQINLVFLDNHSDSEYKGSLSVVR